MRKNGKCISRREVSSGMEKGGYEVEGRKKQKAKIPLTKTALFHRVAFPLI